MMKYFLLLALLLCNSLVAMENKQISPIEIPDITRSIAYALVDVCKDNPEELLSSLIHFSLIKKTVRKSVFPLLNGRDKETGELSKESKDFNNYAISKLENYFRSRSKICPKMPSSCISWDALCANYC